MNLMNNKEISGSKFIRFVLGNVFNLINCISHSFSIPVIQSDFHSPYSDGELPGHSPMEHQACLFYGALPTFSMAP